MKELMIHVERIVRPVRARQTRKLRMRRELLEHLQAALEEERGTAADEGAALDRARKRLGDPAELTRQLQRTVPPLERILQASTPNKWNGWEKFSAWRLGVVPAPVRFAHWLILVGAWAMAVAIILQFSPHMTEGARTRFFVDQLDHPEHKPVAMVGLAMLWLSVCGGYGFIFAAAAPQGMFRPWRVVRRGLLVLATQALAMVVLITQFARRSPTFAEMAQSLGVSLLLLGVGAMAGRGVAALRRPYDEWLMLDIAA